MPSRRVRDRNCRSNSFAAAQFTAKSCLLFEPYAPFALKQFRFKAWIAKRFSSAHRGVAAFSAHDFADRGRTAVIGKRGQCNKEHTEQSLHLKTTVADDGRVGKAISGPGTRRRRFCILFSPEKSMACAAKVGHVGARNTSSVAANAAPPSPQGEGFGGGTRGNLF